MPGAPPPAQAGEHDTEYERCFRIYVLVVVTCGVPAQVLVGILVLPGLEQCPRPEVQTQFCPLQPEPTAVFLAGLPLQAGAPGRAAESKVHAEGRGRVLLI